MVYDEYYQAHTDGRFKATTTLGVKLVYQTYKAEKWHKPSDLIDVIVTVPGAITWRDCALHDMSWIIDHLKIEARDYCKAIAGRIPELVAQYPNHEVLAQALASDDFNLHHTGLGLVVYSLGLGILCFSEEIL